VRSTGMKDCLEEGKKLINWEEFRQVPKDEKLSRVLVWQSSDKDREFPGLIWVPYSLK